MANTVYETVDIKLTDGTELQLRPLTIKNLKEFNKIIKKIGTSDVQSEDDAMEIFIEAGLVCMKQFYPALSEDKEAFEDAIEVPTLMKILEVAGGLKLTGDDPNQGAANLVGTN
jgi:ASC-1-like (ASCH) protein